jgi:hypothetical protein
LQDRDGHTTIFRPVACGNNNITRDYLSSQPGGQGARKGIADRLAAGRARAAGAVRGYRSVRMTPEQVKASAEKRIAEAKAGTRSGRYPTAPQEGQDRYHSRTEGSDRTHQFLNRDGDLTFGRTHVHVIHDEKNDEVRLHISIGEGDRHSEKIALVGATGNEVNAAVDMLTDELRGLKR